MSVLPDEYQDGASAGSLVRARRCWRDLLAAEALHLPQQFRFAFQCPTEDVALSLMEFLQSSNAYEYTTEGVAMSRRDHWHLEGTTPATIWSLSSLEHLFMRMRGAGARHGCALMGLDMLSAPREPA